MSAEESAPAPRRPVASAPGATPARILDAAVRALVRDGASGASMAAIAAEAAVSKALLHYHYSDRAHLLAAVAAHLGGRVLERERAAMERASGSGAVDALWRWLDDELERGELRALLELGLVRDDRVRSAAHEIALERRRAAARTVEHLFGSLGLTPRMPAALLADASLAVIDGLALGGAAAVRDPRGAFDVFWLALLSLAE